MKRIISIFACFCIIYFVHGQGGGIAQFAIWKPKDGQLQNFEKGYTQHLGWHKSNGDKWGWYGWFIVSGPRYGQFVDATFNHNWADFDKAVKPADDMADNRFHVFPFADVQSVFKVSGYSKASTLDTFELKTKLVRLVTITFNNVEQGLILTVKLKDYFVSKQIKTFRTYKVIDGGTTNQVILLMGFSNWEGYGISENLTEKLSELERNLKFATINSISSETLVYRSDMSWFPE